MSNFNKGKIDHALKCVEKELNPESLNLESLLSIRKKEYTDEERNSIISSLEVKADEHIPGADYLLSANNVRILPKGNIFEIKAKPKAGKSFLCTILAASVLGCRDFGFSSYAPNAKVLYLDTEQSRDDTQKIKQRVNVLTGHEAEYNHPNFTILCLSELRREERFNVLTALIGGGYDLVIVDGMVDLCEDYNDSKGCQALMDEVNAMVKANDVCLISVHHIAKTNAENGSKGSLGSNADEKCHTCWMVEKKDRIHNVSSFISRKQDIEDFSFVIDENGIPRNAGDIQTELKKAKEELKIKEDEIKMRVEFRELFGSGIFDYSDDETGLTDKELQARFIEKNLGNRRTYYSHKQKAIEKKILTQIDDKIYYNNSLENADDEQV